MTARDFDLSAECLAQTNAWRAAHGLPPLAGPDRYLTVPRSADDDWTDDDSHNDPRRGQAIDINSKRRG